MQANCHVAFLRGINVGGNVLLKSGELKKAFSSIGLINVATVLASGNIVFEARDLAPSSFRSIIEKTLAKRFNLPITAIIRDAAQIRELLGSCPFKKIKPGIHTKVHVTFLAEDKNPKAKFPVRLPVAQFEVIQVSSLEICSVVDLSSSAKTPELMRWLEKNFGKNLTTRTWSTVEKVGGLMG